MRHRSGKILGILGLLLLCSLAAAQPVIISPDAQRLDISRNLVWSSAANEAGSTPAQVLGWFRARAPQLASGAYPSAGIHQDPLWFYVPLESQSRNSDWLLDAGLASMDHVDLFLFDQQGTLVTALEGGDQVPWSQRPFPSTLNVFPLTLVTGQSYHLLIRAHTSNVLELPTVIYSPGAFSEFDSLFQQFTGIYFGAIAVMVLFNLLLYVAIRDKSFLFYVLYLGSLAVFLLARNGILFRYVWPEAPLVNNYAELLGGAITMGFAGLFAHTFMNLKASPWMSRITLANSAAALVVVMMAPFSPATALSILSVVGFTMIVVIVAAIIIRIRDQYQPARYFAVSFAPLAIFAVLYFLKLHTIIESNWLLEHGMEIGSALEAWLLSFALAYRFTTLKEDNERIQREATLELERRVSERTRELNDALTARSEFLAVMSHEVRTPLNGILGTVDILKDSNLDSDQKRKIHVIEQSGNGLLALINDILDYSRIESGKLPISEEHFNLAGLVRECVSLFEQKAKLNGNLLDTELAENLGTLCHGDPVRVRQILGNLVSNAVKFTENGAITISIQRDPDNLDYVSFIIADTGIGIPASVQPRLFEQFNQADKGTSRRYGGTGLGLAICRQLVELLGGEIGVESEKGKGSRFWFRLPLPVATSEIIELHPEPADVPADVGNRRVLIVDDNHVNLMVAQGLLRKLGHDVEIAESGPEALAILLNDSRPFDLILMDCEMPGMDGFQASREIIRLQGEGKVPAIPIVALTAHAVPEKIKACAEAGMVSHIAKPINSKKLERELRAIWLPEDQARTLPRSSRSQSG